MSGVITALISAEQFMAMPEDGVERELIRGQLREREMARRNRFHSAAVARITHCLSLWKERTSFRGQIHTGDVGCRLRRNPDTVVGIDVAIFSEEIIDRPSDETTLIEGAPILAVEVLSPSDKIEEVHEKVVEYLANDVAQDWLVNPYFQTVEMHRPDADPVMFNRQQTLEGGAALPGLSLAIADLFRS